MVEETLTVGQRGLLSFVTFARCRQGLGVVVVSVFKKGFSSVSTLFFAKGFNLLALVVLLTISKVLCLIVRQLLF